jgi:hypothetical protein
MGVIRVDLGCRRHVRCSPHRDRTADAAGRPPWSRKQTLQTVTQNTDFCLSRARRLRIDGSLLAANDLTAGP